MTAAGAGAPAALRRRARAGVLAAVVVSLGGLATREVVRFGLGRDRPPGHRDQVSGRDHRIAAARPFVRPAEQVGFDAGRDVHTDESADAVTALYYAAQYSLAPALVVPDRGQARVIVFRGTEEQLEKRLADGGLRVLVRLDGRTALAERTR